jgi:hypothetical protein
LCTDGDDGWAVATASGHSLGKTKVLGRKKTDDFLLLLRIEKQNDAMRTARGSKEMKAFCCVLKLMDFSGDLSAM